MPSLVGSEMCIRDSIHPEHQRHREDRLRGPPETGPNPAHTCSRAPRGTKARPGLRSRRRPRSGGPNADSNDNPLRKDLSTSRSALTFSTFVFLRHICFCYRSSAYQLRYWGESCGVGKYVLIFSQPTVHLIGMHLMCTPTIAWMVAHPVMQVIGEQAIVDILDLSKVAWTCWGCTNTSSGLGLRMVKDSDTCSWYWE